MDKRDKLVLIGAAAVIGVWLCVYMFMIRPNYDKYEEQVAAAQGAKDKWLEYYKPKNDGQMTFSAAQTQLDSMTTQVRANQQKLKDIEFAHTLQDFDVKAAGQNNDPKNYLNGKREAVYKLAQAVPNLKVAKGLEDLGTLRGKLGDDPPALNLIRLMMVSRFLKALTKSTGISELVQITHNRPRSLKAGDDLPDVKKLFEVPMIVQLRGSEQAVARLLNELQQPTVDSGDVRSYFVLRGVQVYVKNPEAGALEISIAVGALFNESVYPADLQNIKEDDSGSRLIE